MGMVATVPDCATLTRVITAFGTDLRRRRDAARMSRKNLARLSGVSESQIGNLELQGATPTRQTVIDLARALPRWDIDDALSLVGYGQLTDDEHAELAQISSPRAQLDQILDDLPGPHQVALLGMLRAFLGLPPLGGTEDENPVKHHRRVHVETVELGKGDILGEQRRARRCSGEDA